MKLFIWRDVLSDYTPGIAFAAAETKEEAIEAIHRSSEPWTWEGHEHELRDNEPEVHELPYGGWNYGGG